MNLRKYALCLAGAIALMLSVSINADKAYAGEDSDTGVAVAEAAEPAASGNPTEPEDVVYPDLPQDSPADGVQAPQAGQDVQNPQIGQELLQTGPAVPMDGQVPQAGQTVPQAGQAAPQAAGVQEAFASSAQASDEEDDEDEWEDEDDDKDSGKKKPKKKAKPAYTKSELRLMSAIIFCEANLEPYAGKLAVGIVVMNRVESKQYPSDIKSVIYQRFQFSPVRNGSLKRALARYDAGKFKSDNEKQCIKAAKAALSGEKSVIYRGREKNMKGYKFFSVHLSHARYRIGGHLFR